MVRPGAGVGYLVHGREIDGMFPIDMPRAEIEREKGRSVPQT